MTGSWPLLRSPWLFCSSAQGAAPPLVGEGSAIPKTPVQYLLSEAGAQNAEGLRGRHPGRSPGTQPLQLVNAADLSAPVAAAELASGQRAEVGPCT